MINVEIGPIKKWKLIGQKYGQKRNLNSKIINLRAWNSTLIIVQFLRILSSSF